MALSDIDIKVEYRSPQDDIVAKFLVPALKEAKIYKRAVGFFSSTSLLEISKGISELRQNNGKIKLVASPKLSEEDIKAIHVGYKTREQIVEDCVMREVTFLSNCSDNARLNMLANLIADGTLDIKIVITDIAEEIGMYHEKMGIISDEHAKIAFSGSPNESVTALRYNYEVINVFWSWHGNDFNEIIKLKEDTFDRIWSGTEPYLKIIDTTELKSTIINQYKTETIDWSSWKEDFSDYETFEAPASYLVKSPFPEIPEKFKFHKYQEEAIESWIENNGHGIFDMATGTGKTFTGLGAVVRLSKSLNHHLAVFIVCPYQHLVEQWVEDIMFFGMNPIIGYSASKQKDWKERLNGAIRSQKLKTKNKDFFCFISTNATFSSVFVQEQIKKIRGNQLLLVDEAHNFGSGSLSKNLTEGFNFRLALSATLERHGDEEGTKKLFKYFGKKCIEYDLERAILEEKLTPYVYNPVLTYLNESETVKYHDLSFQIGKCLISGKNGKKKLSERGKMLLIERARLVAGIEDKIIKLKRIISDYRDDKHLLVYCGATTMLAENQDKTDITNEDIRQIDLVTKILGQDLDMKVAQFTSNETAQEREMIKEQFSDGKLLQALIAIKCLDEGVNIPKIKTAFILASTTNPKEYIQRRGRVLRLAKGKNEAVIYDFITLPKSFKHLSMITELEAKRELALVKKELIRMIEFSRLAKNFQVGDGLIENIMVSYNLNFKDLYSQGEEIDE